MAKLTLTQAQIKLQREKARQDKVKKKMEVQEKIELFGENWKQVEQQKITSEIEAEIGGLNTPKIYDSQDLYEFFDPILMYKDPDNNNLNMDYGKFMESKNKYQRALDEINLNLQALKEEENNNATQSESLQTSEATVIKEKPLDNDGKVLSDQDTPLDSQELIAEEQLSESERKISRTARTKGRLNQIISTYFNRFVPLYNKHICTCCGRPKGLDGYYVVYNLTCSDRVDVKGSYHLWICKDCVQKLFAYYYSVLTHKDIELTMKYLCASLNLYWDIDIFYQSKQNFENSDRKGTLIGSYISEINKQAVGMIFMDSPFLSEEHTSSVAPTQHVDNTLDIPYDWTPEEARNKKDVVKIFGYDPFEFEENEAEKKILYADLISVVDEEVQQDYVKLQSALTIVKSFNKVRKLDERIHEMEKDDTTLKEQKDLADLKAKELKAISDFSRDSGFSERFKAKQSLGQTSFTGLMKQMREKKYENELINKYDIATSSTIQAAADASFKAIFSQLNLSDAEVYKIAEQQLNELRKLRQENDKLQEQLRQAKYSLAELSLKEKARAKGVIDDGY